VNPVSVSPEKFDSDCKGILSNCFFSGLVTKESDSNYDPFDDSVDSDSGKEELVSEENNSEDNKEDIDKYIEKNKDLKNKISLRIIKVNKYFAVKCDALFIPTSNNLDVLNNHVSMPLYNIIDRINENHINKIINTGSVYPIYLVKNKYRMPVNKGVYRCVVFGHTSMTETNIQVSLKRAFHLANADGCNHVAIVPMDYNVYNDELSAISTINACLEYVSANKDTHIKSINLLCENEEIFNLYQEIQKRHSRGNI
jgi:hypothetical protein